jgi:hypothetical protein
MAAAVNSSKAAAIAENTMAAAAAFRFIMSPPLALSEQYESPILAFGGPLPILARHSIVIPSKHSPPPILL